MILSIRDFGCYCVCRSFSVSGFRAACNTFSYDFSAGMYILQGEIDCGAWAFASSISDYCTKKVICPPSEIWVNGEQINYKQAEKLVCYLDKDVHSAFGHRRRSAYEIIEKSVAKVHYPLSADELFELFEVPRTSAQKWVANMSVYYMAFVAIDGMIRGKKIFTTAWKGQFGSDVDVKILTQVGKVLAQNDCILIVPSSEKNVFGDPATHIQMLSLLPEVLQQKYGSN